MPLEMVGCLLEYDERLRADTIGPHGVGRVFGLHELLEGFHVGHVHDQPDTVGLRRVGEELARNAHRPEDLLPLGRVKPVVDVVGFVKGNDRWHVNEPPPGSRDRGGDKRLPSAVVAGQSIGGVVRCQGTGRGPSGYGRVALRTISLPCRLRVETQLPRCWSGPVWLSSW